MSRSARVRVLAAALAAVAGLAYGPAAAQAPEGRRDAVGKEGSPSAGEVKEGKAEQLRGEFEWRTRDVQNFEDLADRNREIARLREADARRQRLEGNEVEAQESLEKAAAASRAAEEFDGWVLKDLTRARAAWDRSVEAFEDAAEAFAREGRHEDAARCYLRAAEEIPVPTELEPDLLELRRWHEPGPGGGDRMDWLEGRARRLRKAADQLEAAGKPDEAKAQREAAAAAEGEAKRRRGKAADGPPPVEPDKSQTDRFGRLPGEEGRVIQHMGVDDVFALGDLLLPDFNFPDLPVPQPATQKMIVDGVADELQPALTIADRGREPVDGRSPGSGFGVFFASFSPAPPAPAASAPPASKMFFSSLGRSTGEAFDLHVVSAGALPEGLTFNGLVVEPLKKEARSAIERQVRKFAGGKRATARVDAYCLEFLRLPPEPDMVFRIAAPEAQRAFAPMQHILAAARSLRDAGALSPDSDPAAYFHSIRQWAVWTKEQGFDEGRYADAFVQHTRKNVEASGGKWKGEMDKALRQVVPGRWRDIQRILAAASGAGRSR